MLQQALDEVKVLEGDIEKKYLFAHPRFVEPMLEYIIGDFEKFYEWLHFQVSRKAAQPPVIELC